MNKFEKEEQEKITKRTYIVGYILWAAIFFVLYVWNK